MLQERSKLQELKEDLLEQKIFVDQLNTQFKDIKRLLRRNSTNGDAFADKWQKSNSAH